MRINPPITYDSRISSFHATPLRNTIQTLRGKKCEALTQPFVL